VYEATRPIGDLGDGTRGFSLLGVRLPSGWFDTETTFLTKQLIDSKGDLSGWRKREEPVPAGPVETLPGELAVLPLIGPKDVSPDWVLGCHLMTGSKSDSPAELQWVVAPDADATLQAAIEVGIQSQRLHPPLNTKWWAVEPEKGRWTFADDIIDEPIAAGMSVLGMLDGTAKYASTAPAAKLAAKPWPDNWGVYPPKDEADWRNYVRVMVRRYQDRIREWEIWNEPDNSAFLGVNPAVQGDTSREEIYVGLLKAASEEIRAIDPGIKIVAGVATAGAAKRFLLKSIDLGLLDYCDVISFHGYGRAQRVADRGADAFSDVLGDLRAAMQKHGKTVPIWDTESSAGSLPAGRAGIGNSELELKGILARRAAGISRLYLYNGFKKTHPLNEDWRMLWGFNGRPLPVQALIAANRHVMADTAFVASLGDETKGMHVFLFESAGRRVLAGWVSGVDDAVFAAPPTIRSGRILSQTGVDVGGFQDGRLPLVSSVRYFILQP
jgi:polysaccharide biosynthesis protein PslG